jgi:hypothetical protein
MPLCAPLRAVVWEYLILGVHLSSSVFGALEGISLSHLCGEFLILPRDCAWGGVPQSS